MWYYVKDNKRKGPVSKSALSVLYQNGEIDKDTLVWRSGQKTWEPLANTSVRSILLKSSVRDNMYHMQRPTVYFRVCIFAVMALLGIKIYLSADYINLLLSIISDTPPTDIQAEIAYSELNSLNRILKLIAILSVLPLLRIGYKWIRTASVNALAVDKSFMYASPISAYGFLLPIINLVLPLKVMVAIVESTLKAHGKRIGSFDLCIISVWYAISLMALLAFLIYILLSATRDSEDGLFAFELFSVCTCALGIFAGLMWIILISRIEMLQNSVDKD